MKCQNCTWETLLPQSVPLCPFCGTPYPASEAAEGALLIAETAKLSQNGKDIAESYRTAADKGSLKAAYEYAVMAESGIGMRRNPTDALCYYRIAASGGNASAAASLGRILLRDYGKEKSEEALFWLLFATAEEDKEAPYTIATHYENEDPMFYLTVAAYRKNHKAAVAAARRLDQEGEPDKKKIRGYLALAEKEAFSVPFLYLKYLTAKPELPPVPHGDKVSEYLRIGDMASKQKEDYIALTYYAKASREGSGVASVRIGNFYATGRSVPKSLSSAGKWYLEAADAGDNDAMVSLGEMFLSGNGIERDVKKALTLFCRCAAVGNAKAEFLAAELYFEGAEEGIARDIPLALSLYEKSAEKGYAPAMDKRSRIFAAVAAVYQTGNDLLKEERYEEAVKKFTLAAEMGHGGAVCNLGYCYQHGLGCKKNLKTAMALYQRGILDGKSVARYNLGLCYLKNQGVRFDPRRAEELLYGSGMPDAEALITEMKERKKKKEANRLYSLGCVLLRKGESMDALRAFTAAAAAGSRKASAIIGCHYEFGTVTAVDMAAARRWYQKANLSLKAIDRLKRGFLKSCIAASNLKLKR